MVFKTIYLDCVCVRRSETSKIFATESKVNPDQDLIDNVGIQITLYASLGLAYQLLVFSLCFITLTLSLFLSLALSLLHYIS